MYLRVKENIEKEILIFLDNYIKKLSGEHLLEIKRDVASSSVLYSKFILELNNIMNDKILILESNNNFNLLNSFNDSFDSFIHYKFQTICGSYFIISNKDSELNFKFSSYYGLEYDSLIKEFFTKELEIILKFNEKNINDTLNNNGILFKILTKLESSKTFNSNESIKDSLYNKYLSLNEVYNIISPISDLILINEDIDINIELNDIKNIKKLKIKNN